MTTPMNVIRPKVHGVIDYAVAALLIAAPWIFGFSDDPAATWVTVAFGAVAVLYSVTTDYELGLFPLMAMRTHLAIDVVWCVLLLASPWLFGFADRIWWPHVLVALAGLGVVALSWGAPAKAGEPPPGEKKMWSRSRATLAREPKTDVA